MVFGIIVFVGMLGVYALCRWNYYKGRSDGMIADITAWCEAYDQIKAPNWQSLPITGGNREQQEATNKLYVEMFKMAHAMIGREMVAHRVDVLCRELDELGVKEKD